jgi:surface protein
MYTYTPQSWSELKTELQKRRIKYGIGTESNPVNLNDIDVSNVTDMSMLFTGRTQFAYIDISEWNMSNVTVTHRMFAGCKLLMSIGDISNWNIDNITVMKDMFKSCNVDIIPDWYDIIIHDRKILTETVINEE